MKLEQLAENRCFGGRQIQYKHQSAVLSCEMVFSVYLPPQAESQKVPVVYWLSGLTCTDQNFVQKAGAQRVAAELGLAIVTPDTSPRGEGVPDDADGAWDFGLGAGFYLNATEQPWVQHYRMYDYIVDELPALLATMPSLEASQCSIMGHSMGGHGALSIALKNPGKYQSVSAFAPICAPMQCLWGQKALRGYLGEDQSNWRQYDTCELLAQSEERLPLLVDQGGADNFLTEQLKPELLQAACERVGHPLDLTIHPHYDHSYFFIASFIEKHLRYHAAALKPIAMISG